MGRFRTCALVGLGLCTIPLVVCGQIAVDELEELAGEAGGGGMGDPTGLVEFLLCILGAIVSGSILAYHPHLRRRVASLAQLDAPKIFITYTVIGALAGYIGGFGGFMGFVIFGIGGLMRFRTELPSAKDTGRVIMTTMIGIIWGLAPHHWSNEQDLKLFAIAGLATVFAWLLILVLDWRVAFRMIGRGVDKSQIDAVTEAYRAALEHFGCQIIVIKRNPAKSRFSIVFRSDRRYDRDDFEAYFDEKVDGSLKAIVDWPREE